MKQLLVVLAAVALVCLSGCRSSGLSGASTGKAPAAVSGEMSQAPTLGIGGSFGLFKHEVGGGLYLILDQKPYFFGTETATPTGETITTTQVSPSKLTVRKTYQIEK